MPLPQQVFPGGVPVARLEQLVRRRRPSRGRGFGQAFVGRGNYAPCISVSARTSRGFEGQRRRGTFAACRISVRHGRKGRRLWERRLGEKALTLHPREHAIVLSRTCLASWRNTRVSERDPVCPVVIGHQRPAFPELDHQQPDSVAIFPRSQGKVSAGRAVREEGPGFAANPRHAGEHERSTPGRADGKVQEAKGLGQAEHTTEVVPGAGRFKLRAGNRMGWPSDLKAWA